jgi:hypothetical protein
VVPFLQLHPHQSNNQEVFQMKSETRPVFSVLGGLLLVGALTVSGTLYATTTARQPDTTEQTSAQTQSVTGTIAEVGRTSFTLTLGSAISNHGEQLQQSAPKSMTFMIDKNTTVDGKLKVGANADVTYREDDGGKYRAISVRVS